MFLTRHYVTITAGTSGTSTGYTSDPVNGYIQAIRYIKDATTPIPSTATIAITAEQSGLTILAMSVGTGSTTIFPVSPVLLSSDAASAYFTTAAAAAQVQTAKIPVSGERIKFVMAGAGTSQTGGVFHVYVG